MAEENFDQSLEETSENKFDVVYRCLRCGNQSMLEELNRLPEIKCICGCRVFTKERSGLVKSVQAI